MSATRVQRWKAEVVAGAFLIGIGGFFLAGAWRLPPPDEPGVPGPGSLPIILALVIMACGATSFVAAWIKATRAPLELGGRKQAIAMASLVLGALLFEPAGFLLSTGVFLFAGFTLLGGADWRRALPAAALVSSGLWLVFTKLLGVGLPYGLIGEILFR